MIPYFEQPTIVLGPITLAAFGIVVAIAVVTGMTLGARRFAALGIDRALSERFAGWVVLGGFVGAHLFAVLLYFPAQVADDPWLLLRLWEHISSFGGMVGGTLAMAIFLARRASRLDPSERWAFVDTATYAFAVALTIGRFACALAHDHPGSVTGAPLAISLESPAARAFITDVYAAVGRAAELPPADVLASLGFHDLGWYEFLVLALVVVPAILLRERRAHRAGTHRAGVALTTFIGLYMPVRFALDFLRVGDAQYAGLTPAQWTALAAFATLPLLVSRARRVPDRPYGAAASVPAVD